MTESKTVPRNEILRFPQKMKRHIFFNFHEGQQQQKKQSNTKLNTETQKKHKEQVNERMSLLFKEL